jgi:hypothetical protein
VQGITGPAPSGTGIVTVSSGVLQTPAALTGDVTTTGAGLSATIANNAVTSAKIANGSVQNADLQNSSVTVNTSGIGISTTGSPVALGGTVTVNSNATSSNTASTIVARDASGNFSAGQVNANLNGQWLRIDDRTIEPNAIGSGYAKFGFTSWANNNSSPYADFLHLRSYTDATGGNDNLVMFRKDAIGMRIYQQTWNSATPYSSYKDVAFTDGSNISDAAVIKNQSTLQPSANFNISGSGTFAGAQPLFFTSTGTRTYNKTVVYHDATNGLAVDLAKTTEDINGTPINFHIDARGGGKNFFHIDGATGNTGIGTASPSSRLHVNGAITIPAATGTDNASPAITININDDFAYNGKYLSHYGMGFHSPTSGCCSGAYMSGYSGVDLFTGGANRISIKENGNVGIATDNPLMQLDVQGARTIRQGNLVTYVRTFPQSGTTTTYDIARQVHDHVNWGSGGILVEVFTSYYQTSVFDYGMHLARYGYSGGSSNIVTKIAGGSVPFWSGTTYTGVGNNYFRNLRITVPEHYLITIKISTAMPVTTNSSSTEQNTVYFY